MKNLFCLFLISLSLLFLSCKNEIVACGNADKTSVIVDEIITFTNCSESGEALWDFGDGTGSVLTGDSVQYSYAYVGNYTVTLYVLQGDEEPGDQLTIDITVN
ncbi:MAG: PKD domain-containing protein [Fimbriimonadaceae bacterium]|nr:PKD domain-containing protein [Chitinophagales bacterium]